MNAPVSDEETLRRALLRAERRIEQLERKVATIDKMQAANDTVNVNLYRELQVARERLVELDRQKSQFFANISHELRTPLTLSVGPLELLLQRPDLPPDVASTVRRVLDNKRRLLKQINELLDLASLDAGMAKVTFRLEDVGALVRVWAATARTALDSRRIGLEVALPDAPAMVWLDRARFETIFMNLLSNAYKFTPDGGRIGVAVELAGDEARVRVSDTGIGIAPEHQARIFERFTQVDGSDTRARPGTGIGLALVRELTQLHGGRVAVESAPGRGSTFTLTLRLGFAHLNPAFVVREAAPPPDAVASPDRWLEPAAAAEEPPVGDGPSVLVVEDNAEMRAFLRQVLRPHFRVRSAADGLAGLEAARREAPDVIVSDVQMPRMSGFELLRAVRADAGPLRATPLVLLTSQAESRYKLEGLNEGADDYVVKPFQPDELVCRIRNLAKLRRQERALAATVAELQARRRELDLDLAQARAFQRATLPALPDVPGLRFGALYAPAEAVGGDLYDLRARGGRVRVFLADAIGHGIQASLRTMVVRTLYERHRDEAADPAALLARLNEDVVRSYGRLEVRLAACCFDVTPDGVAYANAGLPPLLVFRAGASVDEVYEAGAFVGMVPGVAFPLRRIALGAGDRVVAFTDGLAEQWNRAGDRLAEATLRALLGAPGPVDAVLAAALARLEAWRDGRAQADDITAVGVEAEP